MQCLEEEYFLPWIGRRYCSHRVHVILYTSIAQLAFASSSERHLMAKSDRYSTNTNPESLAGRYILPTRYFLPCRLPQLNLREMSKMFSLSPGQPHSETAR